MESLQIYDSQGRPLGEERGAVNQRIKDFFFDGVRAALTKTGSTYEFICFFRARDSSASRSEQYYGVLETRDQSELSNFRSIIEERIEGRHDKILDTSSEDTTVFEALGNVGMKTPPGEKTTRDDVADLVTNGEKARLGVGSYEEATVLFQDLIAAFTSPRLAIAENAQSSQLSEYDVVIEKGPYTGLELLGNTADRIEEMKERRRRRRQQELGVGPYSQQSQSKVERFLPVIGAAVGVIVAIALVLYGACFLGVSIPIIGGPPGCGDGGPTYEVDNVTAQWEGTNLTVNGTLLADGTAWNGSPNLTVELRNSTGAVLDTQPLQVNASNDGRFNGTLTYSEAIKRNATVVAIKWLQGVTGNTTLESPDEKPTTPPKETDGIRSVSAQWQDSNLTLNGMLMADSTAWNESEYLTVELRNDTTTLNSAEYQIQIANSGAFNRTLGYTTALRQNATEVVVKWKNTTESATLKSSDGETATPTTPAEDISNVSAQWKGTNLTINGTLLANGTAWNESASLAVELRNETSVTLDNQTLTVDTNNDGQFNKTLTYSEAIKRNATVVAIKWLQGGEETLEFVKLATSEKTASTPA